MTGRWVIDYIKVALLFHHQGPEKAIAVGSEWKWRRRFHFIRSPASQQVSNVEMTMKKINFTEKSVFSYPDLNSYSKSDLSDWIKITS